MKKYLKLWLATTERTTQVAFASRSGVLFFTTGKIIRFVFFLFFLFLLLGRTKSLAGYTSWQVVLFFVVFNLIDTTSQFFLREVYRFRSYIVTGSFDYVLLKPLSPLMRFLFGGSDILDFFVLVPLLGFLVFVIMHIPHVTFLSVFLFSILILNAFMIAISLHIFVLCLGIVTTEVDNAIWLIREMVNLGRVPIAIYKEPISIIFTYVLPVAALISFPAQALMGLISIRGLLICFAFSITLLVLSSMSWRYALKKYTSANS